MNRILPIGAAALLAACSASLPPPELVDARVAYAKASDGPAGTWAPDELTAARGALERAERSFTDHGDTPASRALAYVAARKAETAGAAGRTALHRADAEVAKTEREHLDRWLLREGARPPRSTGEALAFTDAELERRDVARTKAREAAAKTVDALRRAAHVIDRGNGFVVVLPSSSVFPGRSYRIDDDAAEKLDVLARALVIGVPDTTVRIESHADSGFWGDAYDRLVAQRRADAVARYLESRGVARARIEAVGFAPRHVPRGAPDWALRGLDRRIAIVVSPTVLLAHE
jgi:outer membrane protein OmpA-like peptidoglycan-associated protein